VRRANLFLVAPPPPPVYIAKNCLDLKGRKQIWDWSREKSERVFALFLVSEQLFVLQINSDCEYYLHSPNRTNSNGIKPNEIKPNQMKSNGTKPNKTKRNT
jgi:hypothetical protein